MDIIWERDAFRLNRVEQRVNRGESGGVQNVWRPTFPPREKGRW